MRGAGCGGVGCRARGAGMRGRGVRGCGVPGHGWRGAPRDAQAAGRLCLRGAAGTRASVPRCQGGGEQGPSSGWNLPSYPRLPQLVCSPFPPRAKYAVSAIKKKVNDKNPHVALYALEVTAQSASAAGLGRRPGTAGLSPAAPPAPRPLPRLAPRRGFARAAGSFVTDRQAAVFVLEFHLSVRNTHS